MHNIFQNPLHPPVASRHNNMSRKNPPKSRQVLHEIFFNPQWKYKRWAKSIFLKQRPIFLRASSFGEYLNLQYRINKIVSQHSVDYHPSPSRLVLMIHSLIYSDYSLRLLKALSHSRMFVNFLSNVNVPPWLGQRLSEPKKFNVIFLLTLPRQDSPYL